MKIHFLFIIVIVLFWKINVFGQYTSADFKITTEGLSEEYSKQFKENVNTLVDIFNKLNVTSEIKPINIKVNYSNKEGLVLAEINYDNSRVFSSNSDYTKHNQNISSYALSKGISTWLQNQIFTSLSQYKKTVATKGYSIDKEITNFDSAIKLKKSNGDWIIFYAYNYFNDEGFYNYSYYKNVDIQVKGKLYETETTDIQTLNNMNYFFIDKTIGLDGNKTGAYYFCKFFNINPH